MFSLSLFSPPHLFWSKKYPQSLRFSAVTPFASASSAKFLACLKKERALRRVEKMLLPLCWCTHTYTYSSGGGQLHGESYL